MHEFDSRFLEVGDDEVTAASWYGSKLEPCSVDRKLAGSKEEIRLGNRIIWIVFAQDVHGPLHPSLLSNAADYQASLQRLIDLDADVLCEGHFGIYKGRRDIVGFVSSFMR